MFLYQAAVLILLCGIGALVWINHRAYQPLPREYDSPRHWPSVSILVPARNEARNIEGCLPGLLAQEYPEYELLVLDDGSNDGTGELAQGLFPRDGRRGRVIPGRGLPAGWAGKAHACWELAQHASGEWLLFLDADTRHQPRLLRDAVAEAERSGADLLSGFPRQKIDSVGEALTVPFIYWVLFTLLPIPLVRRSRSAAFTAACGQFLLVRRSAYLEVGGHAAIRSSLHDGLHLARLFKQRGKLVRLCDVSDHVSCRMYRGGKECWSGFSRNAYQALGSLPALVCVSVVELGLFLAPFLFLPAAFVNWQPWAWMVVAQVIILGLIHLSLRRRFRYPWLTVLLHPVGIGALLAIQWTGWLRALWGRPVRWKGRELLEGGAPMKLGREEVSL